MRGKTDRERTKKRKRSRNDATTSSRGFGSQFRKAPPDFMTLTNATARVAMLFSSTIEKRGRKSTSKRGEGGGRGKSLARGGRVPP